MSLIVACGGGGGGGDDGDGGPNYPAPGVLRLDAGTLNTPSGPLNLPGWEGASDPGGVTLVYSQADSGPPRDVGVYFLQTNTAKYILQFRDGTGGYQCRSEALTQDEFDEIVALQAGVTPPVCTGAVEINVGARTLKIDRAVIGLPGDATKQVTLSANVTWTPAAPPPPP